MVYTLEFENGRKPPNFLREGLVDGLQSEGFYVPKYQELLPYDPKDSVFLL